MRVVANGDTIWLDLMPVLGYDFDKELQKCYQEIIRCNSWTDGTTYKGEFITPKQSRRYSIYGMRLGEIDYNLNLLLAELIDKYDKNDHFVKLSSKLKNDTPIRLK